MYIYMCIYIFTTIFSSAFQLFYHLLGLEKHLPTPPWHPVADSAEAHTSPSAKFTTSPERVRTVRVSEPMGISWGSVCGISATS